MIDMSGKTMQHLSVEQIDEALITGLPGDLAAEAVGHLAACAMCRQRLAEARMPLESFKAVSMAWSERRSATMPVSLGDGRLHTRGASRPLSWGAGVVAVLAVIVAIPVLTRPGNHAKADDPVPVETARMQTMNAVGATGVVSGQQQRVDANAEQIDRDNQMLLEIDREVNSNAENPTGLGLEIRGHVNNRGAGRAIQD